MKITPLNSPPFLMDERRIFFNYILSLPLFDAEMNI